MRASEGLKISLLTNPVDSNIHSCSKSIERRIMMSSVTEAGILVPTGAEFLLGRERGIRCMDADHKKS